MSKFNPYFFLSQSKHPMAKFVRKAYWGVQEATLPAPPRVFTKPVSAAVQALRASYELPMRLFVTEPLFKAQCKEVGSGVRCDVFMHRISGNGDIIVGDDVLMDGKISISFGARFSRTPTLRIGSHTGIGHDSSFTIGKEITIGEHCRIAGGVYMFDSSGHPLNPADREAGLPPRDEDVRPITIGNNVWIGSSAVIFPGVTIGDGAVVSARSVVLYDVPANTVVAGNPARQVSLTTADAVQGQTAAKAASTSTDTPTSTSTPTPTSTSTDTPTSTSTDTSTSTSTDTSTDTPASTDAASDAVGTIIKLISQVGDVSVVADQDFYDAGFSSVRALQLLLELEDAFNTPIPDDAFVGARTPVALHEMLQQLSA